MSTSNASPPLLPTGGLAWLAALVTVAIWSSFIVITRASSGHALLPLDIMWARTVGAAMILLPWGWWLVRQARVRGEHKPSYLGLSPLSTRLTVRLGLPGGFLFGLLVYSGFAIAPAAHASVLLPGSLPLWTSLLAVWWLGDRLTPGRWLSLACILAGDVLVGGASLLQAFRGEGVWRGDVLFMMGSICWSAYGVLTRKYAVSAVDATIAVVTFSFSLFIPGYLLLVLMGVLPTHLLQAPWQELLFQTIFQGWISVVISGITFMYMIRCFGPVRSTMITAVVPGLSALGAVAFLGEPLQWNLMLGLVMVTLGIVMGVRAPKALTSPAPRPGGQP